MNQRQPLQKANQALHDRRYVKPGDIKSEIRTAEAAGLMGDFTEVPGAARALTSVVTRSDLRLAC